MTGNDLREALAKLGLTQAITAALLGIGERSVRRYVHRGVNSPPVAILIKLLDQGKITPDDIRKTKQSPDISSQWEEDEFYRRIDRGDIRPKEWKQEFERQLPSAEHRGHIRRFIKSDHTDEEDVRLRGFVFWKRLNFRLMTAQAAIKLRANKRGK